MALVPALLRVRVPRDVEASVLETLLTTSIHTGVPANPELHEIPQLAGATDSPPARVLTFALVRHAAARHMPSGPDELVRSAALAADRSVRTALGSRTGATALRARTATQLATCHRALVGAPDRHRHA